jgi:hypothetical protein
MEKFGSHLNRGSLLDRNHARQAGLRNQYLLVFGSLPHLFE